MSNEEGCKSDAGHGLRGLAYSNDGTLHAVPSDAEMWVDLDYRERLPSLCGGGFPKDAGFHPVIGMRLTDELRKGHLCDECLQQLRGNDVTIPGFISDGELVGEAARQVQPDNSQRA